MKQKKLGNLLLFCKVIDPYVHSLPFSKAHEEMARELEKLGTEFNKLNLILPRGTGKTVIGAEKYPLYHKFEEYPDEQVVVVIISKTQDHSIKRLQAIKDIIEYSPEFRKLYGYHGRYTAKVWRDDQIILSDYSAFIARGAGQPIRGINIKGRRPTLIVADDIEDENNTKTKDARDNNYRWLLAAARYALDTKKGKMVNIGTPLYEDSIVMRLKNSTDWKTLHYKYLNEDENGNLYSLWSSMKSVKTLLKERELAKENGYLPIWYAEIQCEIIAGENQLFKKEYFKYYTGVLTYKDGIHILEGEIDGKPFKKAVNVYMGIDPASSVSNRADYSVIMPVAVDSDNNRYILPYFRGRVSPFGLIERIKEYYNRYHPIKVRIESVGYQEMLREYFHVIAEERLPGAEVKENPRNSKSLRIESLEPFFYKGQVYLQPNMTELEGELLAYPKGSHDDTLDALYYAFKNAYPPVSSEVIEKPKNVWDLETNYINWKVI